MRAITLTGFGSPKNFIEQILPQPVPAEDEVLIRIKAVAFNPLDFQLLMKGQPQPRLPTILGFDISGIVEACGSDVCTLHSGDEVFAFLGGPSLAGGYADYVAIHESFVARKPRSLNFVEAAAVPLVGLTALQSVTRAQVQGDSSILITGGAGSVGSWVIQLARARGCNQIAVTARSEASRQYLIQNAGIPADHIVPVLDQERNELAQGAINANYGRHFDAAIDCVGGAMTRLCCDAIGFDGHVVSIVTGPSGGDPATMEAVEDGLFNKSASFHFELVYAIAEYCPKPRWGAYQKQLMELAEMIDTAQVSLPHSTNLGNLSVATVQHAHALLERGHTKGKLLATVE